MLCLQGLINRSDWGTPKLSRWKSMWTIGITLAGEIHTPQANLRSGKRITRLHFGPKACIRRRWLLTDARNLSGVRKATRNRRFLKRADWKRLKLHFQKCRLRVQP